jgi:hypothetical protein
MKMNSGKIKMLKITRHQQELKIVKDKNAENQKNIQELSGEGNLKRAHLPLM